MCFLCKLAMCSRMTANSKAEILVRDQIYWIGILVMLMSKQTIKIFSLLTVVLLNLNLQDKLQWRDDGEVGESNEWCFSL